MNTGLSENCTYRMMQGCTYVSGKCPCRHYTEDRHIQAMEHDMWCFSIVRCKHCRHWIHMQDSNGEWIDWCHLNGGGFGSMGFCSKGEYRNEEQGPAGTSES